MFIDKAMTQAASKRSFAVPSLDLEQKCLPACDHAVEMGNSQSKISAQDRFEPAMEEETFN